MEHIKMQRHSGSVWWIIPFAFILILAIVPNAFAQGGPVTYDLNVNIRENGAIRPKLALNETLQVRAVIADFGGNSLWSNDGTSVGSSKPLGAFVSKTVNGVFRISLGDSGTLPLPENIFDGNDERTVFVWATSTRRPSRTQFFQIPVRRVARAIEAQRLGGFGPDDFIRTGGSIPPSTIDGQINSSQLSAFSNNTNTFTIGDNSSSVNRSIVADLVGANDPSIRYNTVLNRWEFSNDSVTFTEFGAAQSFLGSGSTSSAVDLDTAEVQGVLPLNKGGTSANTAAAARVNLGLAIGVNVAAYIQNNLTAIAPPNAGNDSSQGYSVGSRWYDVLAGEEYVALDVSVGTAIWKSTTQANTPSIADGSVTNPKLAADAVTTDKILNATILAADVSPDTLTAAEIAPDAIGSSELSASGVVPGTYSLATITVDADGRLTSASSQAEVGDISAIGDAVAGDAFVLGSNNGSTLYYEGPTIDSFHTMLSFVGDPSSINTVVIPNISGTLITTGDTGTVSNSMLANSSVDATKLANDAVSSSHVLDGSLLGTDLASDTVTSNQIAPNAIGASELASTTVVPGSYSFPSFTVDADGRVLSATSNIETGDISAVGDATSGDAFVLGSNNGSKLIYEGPTIDAFSTELAFTGDPVSNNTVTIPNVTGTLITSGDTGTVSTTLLANSAVDNSKLANDAVNSAKIQDGSILALDLTPNTLTANEIGADAVGASELASTSVTPGTYSFPSFTVDSDGRITSASSNVETGDISAVGDATSGDAFVAGSNNGSKLVYEGSTVDSFSTSLSFTGDPLANFVVTIPNVTGTLVTTGDSGSVSSSMLAANSVDSSKVQDSSLLASDLSPNTLTSNEIGPDAVGASELASTTVTPGTYSFPSFTVDSDGRITSATSNVETGDISAVGDATSGDAFVAGTNNGTKLVYEGPTVDSFSTSLSFAGDPLANFVVTIPNVTGTLVTTGDTGTVSNSMLATGSVDSFKVQDNSLLAADIFPNTLTSNEIGPDAVGASELASTSVTPGSYSFSTFTVDSDGRITSATSNVETGDISAVGDATSGDAFVAGTNNGTKLVYEGPTVDSFSTSLSFSGDPLANFVVTIPNVSGTLITTGDTGTVSNSMLATDSVDSLKVLDGSLVAADIFPNTLTSNEIGANAVGASELASTTVAPGTYTFPTLSVDSDGRITSASSNTETGDISAVGDATAGDAFVAGTNNGSKLVYEGPTVDSFSTSLSFAGDPLANFVVTIPNVNGTLVTTGDSGTVSNSMLATDSVDSLKVLDGSLVAADISPNTLTANEIGANAVGASELASTTVTPGSYTFPSFTVDSDGRITSATSNAETGDISAVGDATSGDAFVAGVNNGSKLVYEGSTIDSFSTSLSFSGDPLANFVVTIPNVTGTLVTTGDTGTVSNGMLANSSVDALKLASDSVTSSKVLDGTLLAADISPNTLTSNEIGPDAIGPSELASTAVAPGTYTFASITVDSDGRLTSASSNTEAGDISAVGDALSGDAFVAGSNNGTKLVYEGSTVDAFSTTLRFFGDPSSNTIVTIPNITGTLITTGDSGTVSNSMIASGAVDNSKIAADSVTSAKVLDGSLQGVDLQANTLSSNEIGVDAIGASELASTSVVAGSYSFPSFTVDSDGRITSASSNVETGDISSIGDALAGDAFVAGNSNGTKLIYEGPTVDAFSTSLSFSGDPLANFVVSVPNVTGTLITTGDSGTVSNTMLANSSVDNGKLAADAVTSAKVQDGTLLAADLSPNTLTANEIAPDAIGSSELASTTVTPGSYTFASITVDSDGRLTAASSQTETGDISRVGDALSGDAFVAGSNNGSQLVYEGPTVDAFSTTLSFSGDPLLNSIVTIPNVTGTLITTGDSNTVTSTMISDGTISNADLSGSAAIAFSKLAPLTSGSFLLGNGSNVATATALSGDLTVDSSGVATLQANSVDGTNISLTSEASGDLMYFDGTNWLRLGAGTSGQVLTTNGSGNAPAWGNASEISIPHPVFNKKLGWGNILQPTSTTFTAVGINAPTAVGTATASPQTDAMYVNYASTAAINAQAGHNLSAVQTRGNWQPRFSTVVRTDAAVTNQRIWSGLTSATLTAVQVNTSSTASATSFVAVGYDTSGVGDNTNWVCCSGSGANYSCTSTGVPVAASTSYSISVDWSSAATLRCTVNGTSVTRSTLLPATTTNLAIYNAATRLVTATALNHKISKYALEQK